MTRTKYLTETRSEDMVSPTAQRLCDFEAGHSKEMVELQRPLGSRVNESVSVPTMGLTTILEALEEEDIVGDDVVMGGV